MKRNIAIIEDQCSTREQVAAALRQQGYGVTMYTNRLRALQAFKTR